MPKLIDKHGPLPDRWINVILPAEGETLVEPPAGSAVILPLSEFKDRYDYWRARSSAIGVRLAPADDPEAIVEDFDKLQLISVEFPQFTDGRGYSSASLLRERYGWKGELRAVGDVLRDQLFLYARTGFSTFALRDDQNLDYALSAFKDFQQTYQVTAADTHPA